MHYAVWLGTARNPNLLIGTCLPFLFGRSLAGICQPQEDHNHLIPFTHRWVTGCISKMGTVLVGDVIFHPDPGDASFECSSQRQKKALGQIYCMGLPLNLGITRRKNGHTPKKGTLKHARTTVDGRSTMNTG